MPVKFGYECENLRANSVIALVIYMKVIYRQKIIVQIISNGRYKLPRLPD